VLRVALALIDRDQPEAFTMRRLAEEMGMGVMTLYGYARNKEEILEGVTSLAFGEVHRDPPADARWEERLRTEVRGLHHVCRMHPHLVTLVLVQSSPAPGLFRMRERMLDTLRQAGFALPTALHALGVLCHYALGFAGAQGGVAPIELPDRIRELPAAEFPRLTEAAEVYAEHLSDDAFEYGLALILDGLRADLERSREVRADGLTGGAEG
jgi:AcrR family transcriptional regulator